jgi:hypothetical protein
VISVLNVARPPWSSRKVARSAIRVVTQSAEVHPHETIDVFLLISSPF